MKPKYIVTVVAFAIIIAVMLVLGEKPEEKSDNSLVSEFRARLSEEETDGGEIVFYTRSGSVYHLFEDCKSLADSADVRSSTIKKSGKSKVCSYCEKRIAEETAEGEGLSTLAEESSAVAEGATEEVPSEVFWTKGGAVWHVSRECSALNKSKEVQSGTVEESGKIRCCSRCGNK